MEDEGVDSFLLRNDGVGQGVGGCLIAFSSGRRTVEALFERTRGEAGVQSSAISAQMLRQDFEVRKETTVRSRRGTNASGRARSGQSVSGSGYG